MLQHTKRQVELFEMNCFSMFVCYFSYCISFADCPDGITNIQAASGSIAYPGSSSTYGENQRKCWKIIVPDTEIYSGIGIYYNM